MTTPPTPYEVSHPARVPAVARRVAAERARAQILLRLIAAKIEVLTAEATLNEHDTWLSLRPVNGVLPPQIEIEDLLSEASQDPDGTWQRILDLVVLHDQLEGYLRALTG